MQRYKKHELEKHSKRKELFLKDHPENGEILFSCLIEFETLVKKYTDALHVKLFSEECDYICDSIVDAENRAKGINPMSEEYQVEVNLKRVSMGFLPLAKDGTPCDSEKTLAYCKNKILALLCKV